MERTDADHIFSLDESKFDLNKLVTIAFDGASNFSGNWNGVHGKLFNISGREIPYIHCEGNTIKLSITNAKKQFSCHQENFAL